MAEPWSEKYELEYIRSTTKEALLQRSREIMDIFGIDLPPDAGNVVEVGCGAAGGLLALIDPIHYRVAIDPLMHAYQSIGWLPEWLDEELAEYAHKISLSDGFADYVFCIEALDHCPDEASFQVSLEELARIMAPSAKLYFMLPARPIGEHDGHPCSQITQREVEQAFHDLGLKTVQNRYPDKHGVWLCMTKE